MPFLWKKLRKLLTISKSPSPKREYDRTHDFSIEKASLPASWPGRLEAGMTVEAAIVLPLFIFFFLNLGCAIEIIRLHGNLQMALWNAGSRMCVYGYAMESADEIGAAVLKEGDRERGWWNTLADIVLTDTYVRQQIVNYVGEAYLDESPLSQGSDGLRFWESEIVANDDPVVSGDTIDIILTYQVAPWIRIPFVRPFRMANRYYGRLWTGYDVTGGSSAGENGKDMVYVTEHGSVYHESLECTHLKLTIRETSLEEARNSRNEHGGRYVQCEKCRGRPFTGKVFIGTDGDRYHYDRNCSGLKRTIYTITRQQASNYSPCSRCAAAP